MKIMMTLADNDNNGFDSGILSSVFEGLLANLCQEKLPEGRYWDWMLDRWLSIVNTAQAPELDLDESAEEKTDDESKPK